MIKVLSRGTLPDQIIYQSTCSNCRSELEFNKSDTHASTERNETFYSLTCPVCKKLMWLSSEFFRQAIKR